MNRRMFPVRNLVLLVSVAVCGCGSSSESTPDAIVAPTGDAALVFDAAPLSDAAPMIDAAPLGGTSSSSLQIQAIIQSSTGAVDLNVVDVLVTYVKPSATGDTEGFFVQAEKIGPAVYVFSAASTPPLTPSVGDRVSFHVTDKGEKVGSARVVALDNFVTSATGVDVEPLRQEVSADLKLSTEIARYESELIHIEMVIASGWEAASTGHERAAVTSQGMPTIQPVGQGGLWLRLPVPMFDVSGMSIGCAVTLDGILWRFNDDPQPHSYAAADVDVICP